MFEHRVSASASLLAVLSLLTASLVATLAAQPAHAAVTWTLTVDNTGAGSGTVTSVPPGITCGTDCTETYADNTSVTLTPAPDPGFTSGAWSGCDSVEGNQCTVTMTTDKAVTASFLAANGKIAFIRAAETGVDIFTMNPDGTAQTNVTNNSAQDTQPHWSPDGTKIAFVSEVVLESGLLDGNPEIYVMNADGSNVTKLTNSTETGLKAVERNPAWSPDGTKIAFQTVRDGNHEIYVMNANGTSPTNLTNNAAADATPSWSPSGTQIAFRSFRTGTNEIYVMNANGTSPTRITNNTVGDFDPEWSPDGTKIVFASDRDRPEGEVYTMNANGTSQVRLTTTGGALPSWSPDAMKIAFTGLDGKIYVMNANGTSPTNLTNGPHNEPSWGTNSGTSSISVTKTGSGSGTVASSPAGINCGTDCSERYARGTPVTLTATQDAGSTFTGWSGCDSVSGNQCTVTMNADKAVTATFDPPVTTPPTSTPSHVLSATKGGTGSGTVTSAPTGIDCGTTCSAGFSAGASVTLTAAPASGSTFAGWSGACAGVTTTQCTLVMDGAKSAGATFNLKSRLPGIRCDIYGTPGDDVLVATAPGQVVCGFAGDDVLFGTAGADTLFGGGGNDTLWGKAGDDLVAGGHGDDVLMGGRGDDIAKGKGGDDAVEGGRGADRIFGGPGADRVDGGRQDDVLFGGRGDDRLYGARGDDRLARGPGDDRLSGGTGADRLFGGLGDDDLLGGTGIDVLDGGSGVDSCQQGRELDRVTNCEDVTTGSKAALQAALLARAPFTF